MRCGFCLCAPHAARGVTPIAEGWLGPHLLSWGGSGAEVLHQRGKRELQGLFPSLCYTLLDVLSNLCSFSLLLLSEVKPEGRVQASCSSAAGNGCFAVCSSGSMIVVFQVYHPAQLNLQTTSVSSSHVGSLHLCV